MDIIIDEKIAGKTIRAFTGQNLGFSSAILKKLKFSEGGIRVNGESVTVRYVLREGDVLSLAMDDREEDVSPYIVPVDLPLPVVFEDDCVTVVNKPPNMPSHPSLGHPLDTVANALAYRYRARTYVFRPVNRLDRDTSGVMLTANTKLAAHRMALAMQKGQISKAYIAVAEGIPPQKEGVVDGYMHRVADSIITREVCDADAPGARRAVTEYTVIGTSDKGYSVILARPVTGRTHQIRVQLTSIGCPLVGDTLYGREEGEMPRHALHAFKTEFPHPADGRTVRVIAPLPEDMKNWIAEHFGTDVTDALREMGIV